MHGSDWLALFSLAKLMIFHRLQANNTYRSHLVKTEEAQRTEYFQFLWGRMEQLTQELMLQSYSCNQWWLWHMQENRKNIAPYNCRHTHNHAKVSTSFQRNAWNAIRRGVMRIGIPNAAQSAQLVIFAADYALRYGVRRACCTFCSGLNSGSHSCFAVLCFTNDR